MRRALLASLALHAGLAGAIVLHRAIPPAEPPPSEGVALVMLQLEDEAADGAPEPPAGAAEPGDAAAPPDPIPPAPAMVEAAPPPLPEPRPPPMAEAPPPAPPLAESLPPPPPALAAPPPPPPPPALAASPPPPPAPALAELPPPPPLPERPAQHAQAPPEAPPPEPLEAPPLRAEAPPAERPRPPAPAARPPQAAPRPPSPPREAAPRDTAPREAPMREAALRLRIPGAEGPQPQATPGGSARVEGATTPATPDQRNPTPPYPASSRLAGREGSVAVRIEISPEGSVTDVRLTHSAGDPALDEAAISTIRRWRFRPATRDGQQVAASVTTNVHFRLDGRR